MLSLQINNNHLLKSDCFFNQWTHHFNFPDFPDIKPKFADNSIIFLLKKRKKKDDYLFISLLFMIPSIISQKTYTNYQPVIASTNHKNTYM